MCYNIASVVYVLVFWPLHMWDLSSLTRDWTPALEEEALTTGLPGKALFFFSNADDLVLVRVKVEKNSVLLSQRAEAEKHLKASGVRYREPRSGDKHVGWGGVGRTSSGTASFSCPPGPLMETSASIWRTRFCLYERGVSLPASRRGLHRELGDRTLQVREKLKVALWPETRPSQEPLRMTAPGPRRSDLPRQQIRSFCHQPSGAVSQRGLLRYACSRQFGMRLSSVPKARKAFFSDQSEDAWASAPE